MIDITCPQCGIAVKFYDDFYYNSKGKRLFPCKLCVKENNAAYYKINKEAVSERKISHYNNNKEEIISKVQSYQDDNKEKISLQKKIYYQEVHPNSSN